MSDMPKQDIQLSYATSPFIRELVTFLRILVIVCISLVAIKTLFRDSMVVYAQINKPDSMQVFFPIDGVYSEQNSVQSQINGNLINNLSFTLPLVPINYLRIDPANTAATVVITKIEVRHLFGTDIYTPRDLVQYSKPIMMIDRLELMPAGLVIHSTGNDPAFEFKLKKTSLLSQLIRLCIAAVLLSLAIFWAITKLANTKNELETVYLFTIPLWISLGVAALFYPGGMSYDTLHALRSARNGVTDSMWPPMVSYIWRVVDLISLNPSAMHFFQVLLLLLSIFFIIFFFTRKIRYAAVFLFIYLSIPVLLGTIAVIWKDVLMTAFFLAGFAVMMLMRDVANPLRFAAMCLLAIFIIFLGVCSRHNAIAGGIPLVFYLSFIVCSRFFKRPIQVWLSTVLLGIMLVSMVFIPKIQLDKYSLPNFTRLPSANDFFIRTVRVLDVGGASLCVGNNLFGDLAPNLTLDEISKAYDPKHINLSRDLLEKVGVDSRIDKIWVNVAFHHPICFFSNKFQLTKYLIGANEGDQFLITHATIDENEFGYSWRSSVLRNSVESYISHASRLPFFKPWFLYLISILSFIYLLRVGTLRADYLVIFVSAFSYFASLVVFGNAADARLPFYTTTALVMVIFIFIIELKKKRCT